MRWWGWGLAGLVVLLGACDINESMRAKGKDEAAGQARALAAKGGCMGCHAVATTVYGPAWQMVSEHYQGVPDARERLIESIEKGSYGRWDHVTLGKRMPAQAGMLEPDELAIVVDYILALAGETHDGAAQ